MDGEDFSMPSPKRQRTNSPEPQNSFPARPTTATMEDHIQPASDTAPGEPTEIEQSETVNIDDNGILDALMQHVEAEAAPSATSPETALATATTPPTHQEDSNPHPTDTNAPTLQQQDLNLESAALDPTETTTTTHTIETTGTTQAVNTTQITETASIEAPVVTGLTTEQPTILENHTSSESNGHHPGELTETERAVQQIDGIPPTEAIEPVEGADGPEWEVDSSPYESSSDSDSSDSSDDDSSEDDEDGDGDYAMLDPEEAARILMQADGGSDDEGDRSRNKSEGSGLRTANEVADDVPPIPDITITDDMKVEELGHVQAVVENNVLITGKVSGEYQVLESGSLLCLQNRTVVGVVAETLGRVEQPLYTMKFHSAAEISDRGLADKGTVVYYVPKHSSFVFTQPLKAFKGSDASNFHDEEVGDEEMEFSDDEAEAEHKRQAKLKRQGRLGENGRGRGMGRGGRGGQRGGYKPSPLSTDVSGAAYSNGSIEMNYDDLEEGEEGYTPLARPNNLHEMMSQTQSTEPLGISHMPPPPFGDRGRGHNQHRGRRGHDRGGRGGRGNFRGNHNNSNRGGSYQQNNQSPTQYQNPYPNPFPQGQFPYSQTPSAPLLTPQNPSYPYSAITSPISPLPKSQFNFNAGFQAPQSLSPTFHQQQQQWAQQIPAGFNFNTPAIMQFAQQFQQGQQQQQQQQQHQQQYAQHQQNNNGWQVNQAAAAEVQRQLEEMRRAQGGGQ